MGVIVSSSCNELTSAWCSSWDPLSEPVTNTQGQRVCCHKYTRSEGMLSLHVTNIQTGQRVCCHYLSRIHAKVRVYCCHYLSEIHKVRVYCCHYLSQIHNKVRVYCCHYLSQIHNKVRVYCCHYLSQIHNKVRVYSCQCLDGRYCTQGPSVLM